MAIDRNLRKSSTRFFSFDHQLADNSNRQLLTTIDINCYPLTDWISHDRGELFIVMNSTDLDTRIQEKENMKQK